MKYFVTVSAKVEHFGQLNLYLRYNGSLILSVITKNYISLWYQRPKGKLYYRNAFLAQYLLSLLTPSSTDCQKSSPTQQKSFLQFQVLFTFGEHNRNTKTWCEISSKLTITTPRHHWHRTGVFIVNFEQANVGWVLSIQ